MTIHTKPQGEDPNTLPGLTRAQRHEGRLA